MPDNAITIDSVRVYNFHELTIAKSVSYTQIPNAIRYNKMTVMQVYARQ